MSGCQALISSWFLLLFPHFVGSFMMVSWWIWQFKGHPSSSPRYWIPGRERGAPKWRGSVGSSKATSNKKVFTKGLKVWNQEPRRRISTWIMIWIDVVENCGKRDEARIEPEALILDVPIISSPNCGTIPRQMIGALKIPVGRHLACGQGCCCRIPRCCEEIVDTSGLLKVYHGISWYINI